jgi:hypothetical protein
MSECEIKMRECAKLDRRPSSLRLIWSQIMLRGPMRFEEEKNNLHVKPVTVAGEESVTNQLNVALSK